MSALVPCQAQMYAGCFSDIYDSVAAAASLRQTAARDMTRACQSSSRDTIHVQRDDELACRAKSSSATKKNRRKVLAVYLQVI